MKSIKLLKVGIIIFLVILPTAALAQQYSYGVYDYSYADYASNGGIYADPVPTDTTVVDPTYYDPALDAVYYDPTLYDTAVDPGIVDAAAPVGAATTSAAGSTATKETTATPAVLDDKTKEEIVNATVDQLKEENAKKEEAQKDGIGSDFKNFFSEYWVQFVALIVSLIGVILAVSGFSLATKKKQKSLKKFMHEIDDAYSSFKWKSKRCEAELYRLQDQIEDYLKSGKIDENTFQLLEKRIEKYLGEIKDADLPSEST